MLVIICGSSASYMVKNIVKNKGGLHNRLTTKIKLEPFNLNETKQFLKSKNITLENYDIAQLYMIIGGIPYYLEKINEFKDATNTRKGVYLTFITNFGIKQNEYSLNLIENELTIDCLFMD